MLHDVTLQSAGAEGGSNSQASPSMELICPIRTAGTQRFRATGTDRGVGLLDVLRCRNYAAAMLLQYIPANTRACWLGV